MAKPITPSVFILRGVVKQPQRRKDAEGLPEVKKGRVEEREIFTRNPLYFFSFSSLIFSLACTPLRLCVSAVI